MFSELDSKRLTLLLVPCFMLQALAMDIYLPFIPQIGVNLAASTQSIQWTLSIFVLASGLGQPFVGPLIERFGDKQILLASIILFMLSSWLCALSINIDMLVISRWFQGLGACGCLVSCLALCRNRLPEAKVTPSCTLLNATNGIAPLIAPIIGALLLTLFGNWRSCFVVLGLLSVLILLSLKQLKVTRLQNCQRMTFAETIACYKTIFSHRQFFIYSLCGATSMSALFLFFSISPQVIVNQLKFSEMQFSLFFSANALVFMSSGIISTWLQRYFDASRCVYIGLIFMLLGSFSMIILLAKWGVGLPSYVFPNFLVTAGVGLVLGASAGITMMQFNQHAGLVASAFGVMIYIVSGVSGLIVMSFFVKHAFAAAICLFTLSLICALLLGRVSCSQRKTCKTFPST